MRKLTIKDVELAGHISNQIEDLVACMVNLDGLAERVCDAGGPIALQQLQHDMKIAIYQAARVEAEQAETVVEPETPQCRLQPSCYDLGMYCPQASCMRDPYDYS